MEGEIFVVPKWQAHNVENFEQLIKLDSNGRKVLNFASCALINTMPIVGITEITEETKRDLWVRIAIFHAMTGSLFYFEQKDKKVPVFLTQQDVYRHVGLSTEGANYPFVEFCDKWIANRNIEEETSPTWCANNSRSMLDIYLASKE
jgi:hypothetical protein